MNRENKRLGLYAGIIVIVILLIGIIIVFLFGGDKETRISESTVYPDTGALVCESGAKEDAFFHDNEAVSESNKIKVMFTDNHPSQLFYSFSSKYDSAKMADSRETAFRSKYNKFVSEKTLSQNRLLPTFSQVDNEVRVDIYVEIDKMTRAIGTFFFVPEDSVKSFMNYDSDRMKKYYEENGFSCIISI